jgi:hypothetical protein
MRSWTALALLGVALGGCGPAGGARQEAPKAAEAERTPSPPARAPRGWVTLSLPRMS